MGAPPSSKPPNAKLFWLIWLVVAVIGFGSLWYLVRLASRVPAGTIFRRTANGYKVLPPLASPAYAVQTSPRGVVWVQTGAGLARFEGDSWRRFSSADFGTRYDYLFGGFTLDGEEVWGAATDGAVHFDGTRWRLYREAVATENASSIAATNGQVWVIDTAGNLSHFDGRAWSIQKLTLPDVRWGGSRTGRGPMLAHTGQGPLWLVWQGLWQFQNGSWTRVADVSVGTELLGTAPAGSYLHDGGQAATSGVVWVADHSKVVGVPIDGSPKVNYSFHDLGLQDSARVYGVAACIPIFAVATSQGIVWFDGREWHGEQPKELGLALVSSLAATPDGSLLGIGFPAKPPLSRSLVLPLSVISLVFPLGALVMFVWGMKRKARYQQRAMREAVLHATGSLPEDLEEQSKLKKAARALAPLILGGGLYLAAKQYWREAPGWFFPAFVIGTHLIANAASALKQRKALPSDPIQPGGPQRYDWAKSVPAILGALAIVLLLYGNNIGRMFHIRWISAVPGFALLIGGFLLYQAYDTLRGRRVEQELKQGNYTQALEMINGPLRWPPSGLWKLEHADALFFAGRAGEAEPILRELVESERDAGHRTLALEHLGRVLLAQRRYDDAQRIFEAAVKLMPQRSAAYAGFAEIRLRQGLEAAAALEDAERALSRYRRSLLERKGARERLASIHGNRAWALALLGRAAEAQEAIDAGIREGDPKFHPEVAGLHWRAGMAMLAVGNTTSAVSHFRRGVELDPGGYYGKLAAQGLTEHSVWGAAGLTASR